MNLTMILVNLEKIQNRLLEAGRKGTTPAVLIENATLPEQREIYAPLAELHKAVTAAGISGPSIIIVGEVVAVPKQVKDLLLGQADKLERQTP